MSFAWTRALPTFRLWRRSPPNIRLVTLEGRYHLPDIRDLDHIVDTITAFLSGPS